MKTPNQINEFGGVIPSTRRQLERAKHAGLGTIRPDVGCRNCSNCVFYIDPDKNISYCNNKDINMDVSWNQGCRYWKNDEIWIASE